jgi:hypothetical protein
MATLSNVFSDVYISGNCTVKGTITTLGSGTQWTTVGSGIYYNSGNVGIGTITPVAALEVTNSTFPGTVLTRTTAGDNYGVGIQYSLISNTGSFRGYYARAFGGSFGTIATSNQNQANGYFALDVANAGVFASDTALTAVQFYVAPAVSVFNTRVGIGTTNPGSPLTVSGGVGIGTGYTAFTAPTSGLIVQGTVGIGTSNPGTNALQVTGNIATSGFTSNATNTVFNFDTLTVPFVSATQVLASTNVGIGTTNPAYKFHVEQGQAFIGNSAYPWGGTPSSTPSGYNLRFDTTYNGTAGSGTNCNKISMYNDGVGNWQAGFGIENSSVTYQSGDSHTFYTGTTGSAYGTARVKITNAGVLQTFNRPYIMGWFAGGTTAGNFITLGSQQSGGGMTITSSNKLVAPIAGLYQFGFQNIMNTSTGRNDLNIYVNGGLLVSTLSEDNGTGYHYRGASLGYYLNANDYIQFYCASGSIYGAVGVDSWHTFYFYHIG